MLHWHSIVLVSVNGHKKLESSREAHKSFHQLFEWLTHLEDDTSSPSDHISMRFLESHHLPWIFRQKCKILCMQICMLYLSIISWAKIRGWTASCSWELSFLSWCQRWNPQDIQGYFLSIDYYIWSARLNILQIGCTVCLILTPRMNLDT